jgi:hypothetical protein
MKKQGKHAVVAVKFGHGSGRCDRRSSPINHPGAIFCCGFGSGRVSIVSRSPFGSVRVAFFASRKFQLPAGQARFQRRKPEAGSQILSVESALPGLISNLSQHEHEFARHRYAPAVSRRTPVSCSIASASPAFPGDDLLFLFLRSRHYSCRRG